MTADEGHLEMEDQITNIAIKRAATSMRQSAEHGMRMFQSSLSRLKDTMMYEEHGERMVMFDCLIHLYSLRVQLVGTNQIIKMPTYPLCIMMPMFNL